MLSDRELTAAVGGTAYGPDGDKIGTVEHFLVDDRTGEPTWVAVSTGMFGTRHSIVPANEAAFADGSLRLAVTRDAVRAAPSVSDPEHLDPGEEALLREHYRRDTRTGDTAGTASETTGSETTATGTTATGTAGTDGAIPDGAAAATDGGTGGSVVRSEERLRVGTEQTPATRVRVVKYVVTEEVQVTVPVRREEIRIEEVPYDAPDPGPGESLLDGTPAVGRPAGSPAPADTGRTAASAEDTLPEEIVLHREEPVVSVRVVPAERVRLRTEVVAGQERVSARVDRERIAVDETRVAETPSDGAG